MRILWGRVVALVVLLLVAFLLGLALGGDGDAREELAATREELEEVRTQRDQAREQLDAVSAGEVAAGDAGADEATDDAGGDEAGADSAAASAPEGEGGEGDAEDGEVYVVEEGDTLYAIATRAYGDGDELWRIVEANGLDGDAELQAGTELVIPDAGDAGNAEDAGDAEGE